MRTKHDRFRGTGPLFRPHEHTRRRLTRGCSKRSPTTTRALVCIFFTGGNDGNNTVIPNHDDTSVSNYAAYSAARSTQGLALARNTLLPVAVPRIGGLSYGLHPGFGTVAGGINSGLHPLWAQQKLAVVSNIGTLVQPLTHPDYQTGSRPRPRQLFSHTDQSNQQQSAVADVAVLSGSAAHVRSDDRSIQSGEIGPDR